MAFKIMADNGVPISAAQDGAMYDALGQHKSYVIDGIVITHLPCRFRWLLVNV